MATKPRKPAKAKGPMEGSERQTAYSKRHGLVRIDVKPQAAKLLARLRKRTGATNSDVILAALKLADAQGKGWRPDANASSPRDGGKSEWDPITHWSRVRALADLVMTAKWFPSTADALLKPLREYHRTPGRFMRDDTVIKAARDRLTTFARQRDGKDGLDAAQESVRTTALPPRLVYELANFPRISAADRKRLIGLGYASSESD